MNCPFCNSENIASILYGLISVDKDLEQEIEEDKVILGGCLAYDGIPTLHCNECNKRWGNLDMPNIRNTESDENGFIYKILKL